MNLNHDDLSLEGLSFSLGVFLPSLLVAISFYF